MFSGDKLNTETFNLKMYYSNIEIIMMLKKCMDLN